MKKYLITVKGISYEVEVEEIKENQPPQPKQAPVAAAPVVKPAAVQAAPKAPTPRPATSGGKSITAPMPGSIFKVMVKPGDTVKKGDVVIILEAMKMENEIFAAEDGTVATVAVTEGATVNTGDVLVTFN